LATHRLDEAVEKDQYQYHIADLEKADIEMEKALLQLIQVGFST
jgi:hypothetical protein